jgi:hypothetical protein
MINTQKSTDRFRCKPRGSARLGALVVLLIAINVLAGCPRPTVEVEQEEGLRGGACASSNDCGNRLQCVEQTCCSNAGCVNQCRSLMEKDGTAASATVARYPDLRPFLIRKCTEVCCSGATASEQEAHLELWARPDK